MHLVDTTWFVTLVVVSLVCLYVIYVTRRRGTKCYYLAALLIEQWTNTAPSGNKGGTTVMMRTFDGNTFTAQSWYRYGNIVLVGGLPRVVAANRTPNYLLDKTIDRMLADGATSDSCYLHDVFYQWYIT